MTIWMLLVSLDITCHVPDVSALGRMSKLQVASRTSDKSQSRKLKAVNSQAARQYSNEQVEVKSRK